MERISNEEHARYALEHMHDMYFTGELPAIFADLFSGRHNTSFYVNEVKYTSMAYNSETGKFLLYDVWSLRPDTQEGMIYCYVGAYDLVTVVRE